MGIVELLGVVLQVVLAAAGVIISVIEVLRVKKDREEHKKKREINVKLAEMVKGTAVSVTIENIKEQEDGLWNVVTEKPALTSEELYQHREREFADFIERWKNFASEYGRLIEKVEKLYEQLLRDEEMFPLSYGFERYINAFRDFITSKKILIKFNKDVADFENALSSLKNQVGRNGYIRDSAITTMVLMHKYMFLYKNGKEDLERAMAEDSILNKYQDINEKTKGFLQLFKYVEYTQEDLFKRYDDLSPLLEEIRLKYNVNK